MEEAVNSSSNNHIEDFKIEDLINNIFTYLAESWTQLKTTSNQIFTDIGGYEFLDKLVQKSAKHPYLTLGILIGCISVILPFLILLVFALTTIVVTFTGLIFLEGTLITMASVLLFGCLGGMLILLTFLVGITLVGYFGCLRFYEFFNGLQRNGDSTNFSHTERNQND